MRFCDSKLDVVILCSKKKVENHDSQHTFGQRSRCGAQRAQRAFVATRQGHNKYINNALNYARLGGLTQGRSDCSYRPLDPSRAQREKQGTLVLQIG